MNRTQFRDDSEFESSFMEDVCFMGEISVHDNFEVNENNSFSDIEKWETVRVFLFFTFDNEKKNETNG